MGAVPLHDPKWFLSGKRVTSPTSTRRPGCAGRADAVQAHQRGPGGLDEGGELLVRGVLTLIDALQVSDQLGRGAAAGLAGEVAGSDGREQGFGLGGGRVLLRCAGDQLEQQVLDLGHLAGVLVPEGAASVEQHP